MKRKMFGLVLAGVVLGACIVQAAIVWPNLVGVWKGSFPFVAPGDGYNTTGVKLVINSQQGPLFWGFFTHGDATETNWLSGSLEPSLSVTGGFDVSFVARNDLNSSTTGSALLLGDASPLKMTRVNLLVLNGDSGKHGTTTARGTLTKK